MTDEIPPLPEIEARGRSPWRNLSVVWLVPVLALGVALAIAWQAYSQRGGLVEISFQNGGGVTPGETTIRFRDVVIGRVEAVQFSDDLSRVIVSARIAPEVLPFLDAEAVFWVVRPEISAQGVSGLSTVVSGVYIEGAWDGTPGPALRSFTGLERPLFVRPGEEGRRVTLSVDPSMQLSGGAPILFRGIEVGRIEAPRIEGDGRKILVEAFIEAPHDARITQATRFWDTSGFSVNFGASGLSFNVESIASLVSGGLAFDEVYQDGDAVAGTHVFEVFATEDAARASAFDLAPAGSVPVSVQFPGYTRGLAVGLAVVLDDARVGSVTAVSVRTYETEVGPERRHVATLVLDPAALGLPADAGRAAVDDLLDGLVAEGLRARLASGGLLTTELRIELAREPGAEAAAYQREAEPFARIPAVLTARTDVNATAEGILERVAGLPFERLLNQAIETLASIERLAGDRELRRVPGEAIALLNDARGLIGSDETQAIPGSAAAAVRDLRAILAELRASGAIASLTSVLAQADAAMVPIGTASAQLPALLENVTALSQTAAELEIGALVTTARTVLASADTLLASDTLAGVPADLSAALVQLEGLLAGLSEADVVGSLTATLSATGAAASELPELVAQTEAVLAQIGTLSAAYGTRSDFLTEAMDVLGEITAAARSIAQLARTIERNPSSLLTGR